MKFNKIIFLSACIGLSTNFHAWTMEKNQVEQEKNFVDQTGWNDLHKAAYTGDLDAIQTAIGSGIAVDTFIDNSGGKFDGCTAQHLAAINGKADAIRLLVNKFSDIANAPIRKSGVLRYGFTTLHIATACGQMDVIRLLVLELGVNVDTTIDNLADQFDGYTALHWAASAGLLNVIRLLIELKANVHMSIDKPGSPSHGFTAIHLAAISGQTDVISLLVKDYHVNVRAKIHAHKQEYDGWNIMDLAREYNKTNVIIQLFMEFKYDTLSVDDTLNSDGIEEMLNTHNFD